MARARHAAATCVAGFLLCLAGPARANQADDEIQRLVAQARQQAAAHEREGVSRTLSDISRLLPGASTDGLAAATGLITDLGRLRPEAEDPATGTEAFPGAGKPGPPSPPEPAAPPAPPKPSLASRAAPAADPPARAVPSAALLALLRQQGDAALRTGDISTARRFFQRGAEIGCAACAEALAGTFDAEQLRRMGAVGIKADPAQAEAWRARARQLSQAGTPRQLGDGSR